MTIAAASGPSPQSPAMSIARVNTLDHSRLRVLHSPWMPPRSKLINEHYSDEQLRLLGNGAGIHGSIKKAATLRTHLSQHFSPMLSD